MEIIDKLEIKKVKIIERIESERVKSINKFAEWRNKGYNGYRTPNFDKKLDALKEHLAAINAEILLKNNKIILK